MFAKNNRLAVRIFGLLNAVAEGPLAIGSLVVIVMIVAATAMLR